MNKRLEVFEVYLDADWRSHETRDELVAAYCFFARTSQRTPPVTNPFKYLGAPMVGRS